MAFGSLHRRIAALEHDLQQAVRDKHLEPRWQRELATARDQLLHIDHSQPLPRLGVDYSYSRPAALQLRQHGVTFVARYLTGDGKAMNRAEALHLSDNGLDLVSLYEEQGEAMISGATAGRQDGARALDAARQVGMPPHRPIYFACDFDMQPEQAPAIVGYMRAAKESLDGRYYAGGYGGLAFVQTILGAGFTYAWQTLAWSDGTWDPRAQLRQTALNTPTFDGEECDTDYAHAADFGQWKL